MSRYKSTLDWITGQHERMCSLVRRWSAMNTGSDNLAGLQAFAEELSGSFDRLGAQKQVLPCGPVEVVGADGQVRGVPVGAALRYRKRPDAPRRVFLGIHMDTVYGLGHPFDAPHWVDEQTLRGPGVADAKGGLAVMLVALEALERSGLAGDLAGRPAEGLGWEVLINADEEIGSVGSLPLLVEAAGRCDVGLVFEPALPDGSLVGERRGSGNYTVVVRGRSAHAGREFEKGRNAIHAMAGLIVALERLNGSMPGVTVNVGRVQGGGPVNVVPNLAICRFNVRMQTHEQVGPVEAELARIVQEAGRPQGISVHLHGRINSPPKPMDTATQGLFEQVASCGRELGMELQWHSSGGVCDGNKLAAAGLPTVDTLGVCGGGLHSTDEYLLVQSLTQRAKLAALLLMRLATGQAKMPGRTDAADRASLTKGAGA